MVATIKEETKELHGRVEKVLLAKLRTLTSLAEYEKLLSSLYYFYEPVEKRIHHLLHEEILPDISMRIHMPHLKSDLCMLNHAFSVNQNLFAERINGISYAFGVLYVIEGSTLGGQIISSMLKKQLGLDDSVIAYFNSYGAQTHEMWNAFKYAIEAAKPTLNEDEMLLGAMETFQNLETWLVQN